MTQEELEKKRIEVMRYNWESVIQYIRNYAKNLKEKEKQELQAKISASQNPK